ncbi:MAG TPA: hypothetical protein PLP92_07465 [Rhodocyclaceae bacterium]|nr:hypothetical protein [Rhodocyclaceae bacterium]
MKLTRLPRPRGEPALAVVSHDLSLCQPVEGIARSLDAALADWATVAPQLAEVGHALEFGAARHAWPFSEQMAQAWPVAGIERMCAPPDGDAAAADLTLVVWTGALPRRATPDAIRSALRLLTFGVGVPGQGGTLAPVAVSPDELEGVWTADGRLQVSIRCRPAEGPDRVTGREHPQGCFEVINALGEASRAGPQPPGVWCLGAQAPVVPVRPAGYRLEIVDARGGNLCGRIPGVRTSPS